MTYDNKKWRHWGIKVAPFLAWALKPAVVLVFIILNWQNILPVIGYVTFSVIKIMTGHEYATQEETGYLLYCVGQFSGTAGLALLCYFFFAEALNRIPFFTYKGDKIRLDQEE